MKIILILLVPVLALPVSLACGGADSHSDGEVSGVDLRSYAQQLLRETTPEQRDALEDGVITREEYERAVLNTVACMGESGIEVQNFRWQGEKRIMFEWTGPSPRTTAGEAQGRTYEQCFDTYQWDIDRLWSSQVAPTQQEINDAKRWLQDCAAGRGVELSLEELDPQGAQDRQAFNERYPEVLECALLGEEQFGFNPL